MIIDAVTPLLLKHGREVTSKQLADAAGVAEGTVFRAFGDKEALVRAVLEKLLDPEPLRRELEGIDPGLPLADKIRSILAMMQHRFGTVFQLMAVLESHQRPPATHERRHSFTMLIVRILEPDAQRLSVPAEQVAQVLRMMAFASSFPTLNAGNEFDLDELTAIVLHGVAAGPNSATASQNPENPQN